MAAKKTVNLVLEGGGVKGIGLVGALSVLEEQGYRYNMIAGTSAGAIVGGLLAAGYSAKELIEVIKSAPYKKFQDEGFLDRLGLPGKITSLLIEKGIYEGRFFLRWYDEQLARKGVYSFADLSKKNLVICVADISAGQLLQLPRDYKKLALPPERQPVAHAVRASISIPFFYEPVKMAGRYLVDGGLVSNFPVDIFDHHSHPTIGIKLSAKPDANQVLPKRPITGPISYAEAILGTMANAHEQMHLDDPKVLKKTIFVDTMQIKSTDFDISPTQQQELFQAGRKGAEKFLAEHT